MEKTQNKKEVKPINLVKKKGVFIRKDGSSILIDNMSQDDCNEAIQYCIEYIEGKQRNINTMTNVYRELQNHRFMLTHTPTNELVSK